MTLNQFNALRRDDPSFDKMVGDLIELATKYQKVTKILASTVEPEDDKEVAENLKISEFIQIIAQMNPYLELQMKEKGQRIMLQYLKGGE